MAGAALDLDKTIRQQFLQLKEDFVKLQVAQSQIADLRDAKAASEERCASKDQHISELTARLEKSVTNDKSLLDTIECLRTDLAGNSVSRSAELDKAKEELKDAHRKLSAAEQHGEALLGELYDLKATVKAKDEESVAINRQMQELKQQVIHSHIVRGFELNILGL